MLIELSEISKIFSMGESEVRALDGVSLSVEKGEAVAIVGPSGSGKTTLLDILGCLSRPTSGSYRLAGEEVLRLSDAELAAIRNRRIGFVFQTFNLLPRKTALENVALPLLYCALPAQERGRRASESLSEVGLAQRAQHRPNQLSGGQQQRVAIARALVNQPELILADEPTGNLDSASGREIIQLLLQLNRQGHTMILVTHDAELAALAGRTVHLKDGKIVG